MDHSLQSRPTMCQREWGTSPLPHPSIKCWGEGGLTVLKGLHWLILFLNLEANSCIVACFSAAAHYIIAVNADAPLVLLFWFLIPSPSPGPGLAPFPVRDKQRLTFSPFRSPALDSPRATPAP